MKKINILLIGILLFGSCSHKENPDHLEQVLQLAGENRAELEKVLHLYKQNPADSLKYKAAVFLIENMPYYYYFEGEQLDNYQAYYQALHNHKEKRNIEPAVILDSIAKLYGDFSRNSLTVKHDLLEIDSAYLCNNIEWSFKVWQEQPWGKNVSFEDFCEYILPYRIGDEKLSYWKEEYYERYNYLLASLSDTTIVDRDDPAKAVSLLMDSLAEFDSVYFTTTAPPNYPHVGPQAALYKSGSCGELTDYIVYVYRALGIPCHIDYMPTRGDNNVGHFWVSYKDKFKELYAQDFPISARSTQRDDIQTEAKAKVYRYTFSLNQKMQKEMLSLEPSVHPAFRTPLFIDVTLLYSRYYIENLHIPSSELYKTKTKSKIAYLCLAQHLGWTPVAWAEFDKDNLSFKNVQKGVVMRIATWEDNQLVFQSDPFIMEKLSDTITSFSCNDSLQDVVLYSKFEIENEILFRDRMLGGVFEGSNSADFEQRDTLYIINEAPYRLNTTAIINSEKEYKYVRYRGNNDSYCNVSEVEFYEKMNDTIPLKGTIIGTPGSAQSDGSHEYTNVFDGQTWTSFDYKTPDGGWAGLMFPEPTRISKVVYTPRNRDNYIRPGDTFELFYCDKEWKSLGVLANVSDSLEYKNVPKSALLYLKSHSRGTQERIFTFENGKQKWK